MTSAQTDATTAMAADGFDGGMIWKRNVTRDRRGQVLSDSGWHRSAGPRQRVIDLLTCECGYRIGRDTGGQINLRKILPGRVGTNEVWLRNTMPPELR